MFFMAQARNVHRLSLFAGLFAAFCHVLFNAPLSYFRLPDIPWHPWRNYFYHLGIMIMECVFYFAVAWGAVRITAKAFEILNFSNGPRKSQS